MQITTQTIDEVLYPKIEATVMDFSRSQTFTPLHGNVAAIRKEFQLSLFMVGLVEEASHHTADISILRNSISSNLISEVVDNPHLMQS